MSRIYLFFEETAKPGMPEIPARRARLAEIAHPEERARYCASSRALSRAAAFLVLSQYAAVSLVAAVKPARAIGAQLQSPLRASPDAWCAVASVTRPEAVAGQVRPVVPTTIP